MLSFVLIDYENVQPKDIGRLNGGRYKVKVFAGAKQKVPVEIANALQPLGPDAEYIQIAGEGKNALDFHIAYYIGRLAAENSGATFLVISADKGFEPLFKHLAAQNIFCKRCGSIAEIALADQPQTESIDDKLKKVIENLESRKSAKPGTVKTLRSTINALFDKRLGTGELDALVDALTQAGSIKVADGKVQYAQHSEGNRRPIAELEGKAR